MSTAELIVQDQQSPPIRGITNVNQTIALAAAILDKRIATARQWPRSITRFKKEATALLQEDVETARSAEYSKPVGGGFVNGPSVRLAEIACMCWTNIEVEISEPIVSDTSVTVHAFAWDLEKNVRVPGISSTSILKKDGKRYEPHMIENAIMATAAKARRNAIQTAIPRAYMYDLLLEARKVANAKAKPIEQTRAEMLEYFARSHRVPADQVFAFLKVDGIDDITPDHIQDLRFVVTAIGEGEPIEAYFGPIKSKAELAKEKLAERRAAIAASTAAATNTQVASTIVDGGLTDEEKAEILKKEAEEARRQS